MDRPPTRTTSAELLLLACVAAALAWLAPSTAAAQGACEAAMAEWISGCEGRESVDLSLRACPAGLVVLTAHFDEEATQDYEISRDGVAPVGSFPDWSTAPAPVRDTLAALERCVDADDALPVPGVGRRPLRLPWLLLVGLALIVVLERRTTARSPVTYAATHGQLITAGLLCLSSWSVRALFAPWTFFHQNGQGPYWVEAAVSDIGGVSRYGPGYAELFAPVTRLAPDNPDLAIFVVMSLAVAALPLFAFLIVHRLAGNAGVGLFVAFAFAVDPMLARLAQSESYFAVHLVLYFGAAVVLAGIARDSMRSVRFWLGAVAAGLLVAQAVRVHPLGWAAATTLPALVLLGTGCLRWRLGRALVAAAVLLAVVIGASGAALVEVATGPFGQQWLPQAGFQPEAPPWGWLLLAIGGLLLAIVAKRRGDVLVATGLFALTVMTAMRANLLHHASPWLDAAVMWQFAPVYVGVFAAIASGTLKSPGWNSHAFGLLLLVPALFVTSLGDVALPTDARELRQSIEWRDEVPEHALITWVGRADERILMLPLYSSADVEPFPLTVGSPRALPRTHEALYYRSSLCSTESAASACAALEATFDLEPLHEASLPAVGSLPWFPYETDSVDVGLYRIRGAASQ